MTRKRFIKLLMSSGIQRNEAVRIAKSVREYRICNTLGMNREAKNYWIRSPDPYWYPGKRYNLLGFPIPY